MPDARISTVIDKMALIKPVLGEVGCSEGGLLINRVLLDLILKNHQWIFDWSHVHFHIAHFFPTKWLCVSHSWIITVWMCGPGLMATVLGQYSWCQRDLKPWCSALESIMCDNKQVGLGKLQFGHVDRDCVVVTCNFPWKKKKKSWFQWTYYQHFCSRSLIQDRTP